MKTRIPLAYQILAMQLGIVLLAAGVGFAAALWHARGQLDTQYEARSLAIAQSVAADPSIRQSLIDRDPEGQIQAIAGSVRSSTGATYVVVTDRQGIRFSHTNPALIGKPVDENPAPVLAGQTWVGIQRGTLGVSARGKAPIILDRQVIGIVSVGYREDQVWAQLLNDVPGYSAIVLLSIGLGLAGSLFLAARVKKQTFGLEPYEIAGLLEEREASLQGIHEGALATSRDGTITLANEEARRLLEIGPEAIGRKLQQVIPPGRLLRFLTGQLNDQDEVVLVGDRVLLASRRAINVRGHEVGFVTTVRDSKELSRLAPGLGVEGLTDALRAQVHEFSNRLHTIAGLVELGRTDDAVKLIMETSAIHQELSEGLLDRVGDPVLGALLLAKAAVASERGVELRVSEDTMLTPAAIDSDDLITVLGNLLDNAIDAASGAATPVVNVAVGHQEGQLVIRIQDFGAGVPENQRAQIFQEGYSTKHRASGRRRGFGLTLVRRVVDRRHGEISVEDEAGAIFTVRLPIAVTAVA